MKSLCLNFAVKSLINRMKQYRSLFAVSAVGVCIMLSVLMVTDGMLDSMKEKMRQFYGGDFMILNSQLDELCYLSSAEPFIKTLKSVLPNGTEVYPRYTKTSGEKSFFFEGVGVKQRTIQAVDFEAEKKLFEKFNFVEGNANPRASHDGVVISFLAAEKLGVHIGDDITLFLEDEGLKNTIVLVVTGIFQDSSVFGMYTSYVDYNAFMQVLSKPRPIYDKFCVYYSKGNVSKKEIQRVYSELSKKLNMFPLDFNDKKTWQDTSFFKKPLTYNLVPLSANVSDLQKLSLALRVIVLMIVVVLVIIISVGISSTFRVVVMKRAVESGTFRALGMKPSGLRLLYFTEVFVLLFSGCLTGFLFSFVVVKIASSFNLSFISGFDLFLTAGHLSPSFYASEVLFLIVIIFVTTLSAVLFALRKVIHISPVGALATVT